MYRNVYHVKHDDYGKIHRYTFKRTPYLYIHIEDRDLWYCLFQSSHDSKFPGTDRKQ